MEIDETSPIKEFLKERFDGSRFVPCAISGTNQVYRIESLHSCQVVKISGINAEDILNEYYCLQLLSDIGCAPLAYELLEFSGNRILVMEFRTGENLLELILELNTEWEKSLSWYVKLGEWLSLSIHSQKFASGNLVRHASFQPMKLEDFYMDYVPASLTEASYNLLSIIPNEPTEWVLTHGDYGLHNVLVTQEGGFTIFDWEFAEWNHPIRDLASVYFWTHLHFPKTADARWRSFLEGYTTLRPISFSLDLLRAYCVDTIWKLFFRIGDLPGNVKQEWVRRLEWIINKNINRGFQF